MAARPRVKLAKAKAELVKMAELARRSGVPAPTIKHYIRQGLLPGPEIRTSRNMAYYDARLASRIRAVKELQAERFLPLRVIGTLLEPAPSDRLRAKLSAIAPMVADPGARRRKRSEVIKTLGIPRAELASLEKAGVLELRGEGATAGYSGADLQLVELYGEVRRRGLADVFPAALAAPYLDAVRRLVAFEIDVFRKRALGGALPVPLPEIARAAVELGERLVVALRAKLIPHMLAASD